MSESAMMYLIRHGATAQNEQRPVILQGHGINGPLSERGEQQAREVADFMASRPLVAVYASPMLRAQQTAQAIAECHGLPLRTLADLHEVNVGQWEGKSWPEIMHSERDAYDRFVADPTYPYRGGESLQNVLDRVESQFQLLLEQHAGESFAVVAHSIVNRVYLASLLYGNLLRARELKQMNCCVNLIRNREGQTELITMNNVLHLSQW